IPVQTGCVWFGCNPHLLHPCPLPQLHQKESFLSGGFPATVPALRPAFAWSPVRLCASFHPPAFSDRPVVSPSPSSLTGILFLWHLFSVLPSSLSPPQFFAVPLTMFGEFVSPSPALCSSVPVLF